MTILIIILVLLLSLLLYKKLVPYRTSHKSTDKVYESYTYISSGNELGEYHALSIALLEDGSTRICTEDQEMHNAKMITRYYYLDKEVYESVWALIDQLDMYSWIELDENPNYFYALDASSVTVNFTKDGKTSYVNESHFPDYGFKKVNMVNDLIRSFTKDYEGLKMVKKTQRKTSYSTLPLDIYIKVQNCTSDIIEVWVVNETGYTRAYTQKIVLENTDTGKIVSVDLDNDHIDNVVEIKDFQTDKLFFDLSKVDLTNGTYTVTIDDMSYEFTLK